MTGKKTAIIISGALFGAFSAAVMMVGIGLCSWLFIRWVLS